MAPEILKAGVNEPYRVNVDMFSCGVVAYTLLCGYEPFYGSDEHELMLANKNIEYEFHYPEWNNISKSAKDWISRTLCDVKVRMTPKEAMSHPWMQQARHASDMRMLARMRRSVITDTAPPSSLNRSSHRYLSSPSMATRTATKSNTGGFGITEESGVDTGDGTTTYTNPQLKRENATMKASKYRSRVQRRHGSSSAQYSGNPMVRSISKDRHLDQWLPSEPQYDSDEEEKKEEEEESASLKRSCSIA